MKRNCFIYYSVTFATEGQPQLAYDTLCSLSHIIQSIKVCRQKSQDPTLPTQELNLGHLSASPCPLLTMRIFRTRNITSSFYIWICTEHHLSGYKTIILSLTHGNITSSFKIIDTLHDQKNEYKHLIDVTQFKINDMLF